ncbi:MgtC/SapB family protein [soil metagenome]
MKFSNFPIHDQAWLALRVGMAALLGGLIGWERDRAGKRAGIRTHILVAAAASLAVGLGDMVVTKAAAGDPTRMMYAVFTGIGFIGGGMIFTQKRERGPFGITSAATVLIVAGIGAACGIGAPYVAAAVAALTMVTLLGLPYSESMLRGRFRRDEEL